MWRHISALRAAVGQAPDSASLVAEEPVQAHDLLAGAVDAPKDIWPGSTVVLAATVVPVLFRVDRLSSISRVDRPSLLSSAETGTIDGRSLRRTTAHRMSECMDGWSRVRPCVYPAGIFWAGERMG